MMSETLPQSENQKLSKLPVVLDGLSCLSVLGGAIASLVTQQVAFATLPFSVMFTLQVLNRQKLMKELSEATQLNANLSAAEVFRVEGAMAHQNQEIKDLIDQDLKTLRVDMNMNHAEVFRVEGAMTYNSQENRALIDEIQGQLPENLMDRFQKLEKMFSTLKEITDSVNLGETVASAEAYFKRGVNQEQLGNINAAIADYTQAIECLPTYAWAYFRRGAAKLELGHKQPALIDLNTSAKYFFEEGELESYQMAKEKVAEIHGEAPQETLSYSASVSSAAGEPVSLEGLFGS